MTDFVRGACAEPFCPNRRLVGRDYCALHDGIDQTIRRLGRSVRRLGRTLRNAP